MIYIVSRTSDVDSSRIIEWLNYYKHDVYRINTDDIDIFNFSHPVNFRTNKKNKDLLYLRKTDKFNVSQEFGHIAGRLNFEIYEGFIKPLALSCHDVINSFNSFGGLGKFGMLNIAERFNLKIPATIITNKKKILLDFIKEKNIKRFVCKPAHQVYKHIENGYIFQSYTTEIDENILSSLPLEFSMSLFQEYIDKVYDVKIVCIGNNLFAAALISSESNIDIREIGQNARIIPINLPKKLNANLKALLNEYNFHICTVDFVVNKEDEFIFLEINPAGNFADISARCNYDLHNKVAQYLIYKSQ